MAFVAQSTYRDRRPVGFPGMLYDADNNYTKISRQNGEASAVIPFGILVMQDATDPEAALLPLQASLSAQAILGVSIHKHLPEGAVPINEMFSILRKGTIYVLTETIVTAAVLFLPNQVGVRTLASGGNTQLGGFRGITADSDVDSVATLGGAVFKTTAAAGEIVAIELSDNLTLTARS